MKEHLLFKGLPDGVESVDYWRSKTYENIYALGRYMGLVDLGPDSLREIRNYMRVYYRLDKSNPHHMAYYRIHRSGKMEKAYYP